MSLEEQGYYISLASQEEATRDDIIVEYQPGTEFSNYSYTIIKDGKSEETLSVEDNSMVRIVLNETGSYEIEFKNQKQDGEYETFKLGKYIVDKEAPTIEISKDNLKIEIGSTVDIMSGVRATDNQDGNITSRVSTNADELDFSEEGMKEVTFRVSDSAGNTTSTTITFEVVNNHREMYFLKECVAVGIICVVLIMILKYYRNVILERRLGKYSLEPNRKTTNLFEKMIRLKDGIVESFSNWLQKYMIMNYYAKRYEKYQIAFRESSTMNIISQKILTSMLFLILSMIASTIRLEMLSFLEMVLALFIGYILLDIIYFIRYRFYRNNVENDLLQAIIVMNNAFKSGHSISQAVDLVAKELDGDIHEEFQRMSKELSLGLSVEEVFARFAKRIEIDEVSYLTSTLSILNKTGGNIVKVFTSIEKTLMNKKRLRLEMKTLTSSSKVVSYFLMLLPLFFVLSISFISPEYLLPLITTMIGRLILVVIILIYILYVCIVKKIMKVRM